MALGRGGGTWGGRLRTLGREGGMLTLGEMPPDAGGGVGRGSKLGPEEPGDA